MVRPITGALCDPAVSGINPDQAGKAATADDGADKVEALRRLARIEGQIRGINKMVESDADCIDVLTQISAATRALQSVALRLVDAHLHHCLVEAAQAEGPRQQAKLSEASAAIARLVRS